MRLESRLRGGLRDAAEDVRPDVEARLSSAVRVHRRRTIVRRTAAAVVAAGLILGAVAGGRSLLGVVERPRPAESPPATIPAELAGRFERTVPRSAAPDLQGVVGRFELRLSAEGVMILVAPRPFDAQFGDVEGLRYSVEGDVLVSGAFFDHCGEPMRYRWNVAGTTLTLSTTGPDPCRFRRIVFTGGPWIRIGE